MPYIELTISGNEKFGGYLSVDGGSSVEITNDAVYEIGVGQHLFEVHSTSDSSRKIGKLQSKINNAAYNGGILDMIAENQADNAIGDNWSFSVVVEEDDCVELNVLTKGNKIIAAPQYRVSKMSDEKREHYEQMFREIHEEEERIANMPRRSKKQIGWGIGLVCAGLFGISNAISMNEADISTFVVLGGLAALGVVLFLFGIQKKVRR